MKIVELLNNIKIPLTNEEWELLSKFNDSTMVLKSKLDARDQLIANSLVKKDVLIRKTNEGKTYYRKKIR
jgi:hypothetical protein